MDTRCDTCRTGHMEYSHFCGNPVFVHKDGTRELCYECDCTAPTGERE